MALSLLAGAGAWTWYAWPDAGLVAAGFLTLAGVYASYFALLFIAIHYLNRTDPQPRATLGELLQAWLREVIAAFRVFLWRQPFRSHAMPDFLPVSAARDGLRGVVFIHGFICNRGFWAPWMTELKAHNRAFVAVNLEPIFGSIEDYVPQIEAAVTTLTRATGLPPTLICHSMGGLAARAWLRSTPGGDERVERVITLGTPHAGTLMTQRQPYKNSQQMARFSAWTRQLDADESAARRARFICWHSNCDNVVVPSSSATLAGADNRLVTAQGHVSLAFDARVMRESLALLVNPVDAPTTI